jgi:hypothetical protein
MYDQVQRDLDEIIVLLQEDGSSWLRLFKLAKQAFEQADYDSCGSIILSGSGGMGSLNDIVLGQGHDASEEWGWKPGCQELNDKFQVLLGRLYTFAEKVSRR